MRATPQKTVALFTFTKEILNGKIQFLCSEGNYQISLNRLAYHLHLKKCYRGSNEEYRPMSILPAIAEIFENVFGKQVTFRSSCPEVFFEKVFLEISRNSQENTCARNSFW